MSEKLWLKINFVTAAATIFVQQHHCQLEARTHTWTVGDDNSNHTLRDLFWVVLEKWRGTKVRWRWHFSAFTVSQFHFHFLTFTFWLSLSHFYFHTTEGETFPFKLSHKQRWKGGEANRASWWEAFQFSHWPAWSSSRPHGEAQVRTLSWGGSYVLGNNVNLGQNKGFSTFLTQEKL